MIRYKNIAIISLIILIALLSNFKGYSQCVTTTPPEEINFTASGGTQIVTTLAGGRCLLEVSDNRSWISTYYDFLSKELSVTVTGNSGDSRSGWITIEEYVININQAGVPPARPGTISGASSLCPNHSETYSISSVANATSYTWIVPSGASIVSGQGTTQVEVDFGSASGYVKVRANNSNGSSSYRLKYVTVNAAPNVYNVTGGGDFCIETGKVISLDGSQSGVTYQLLLNGSSIRGSEPGTGSEISFERQFIEGRYTVVATNTSGCTTQMFKYARLTAVSPPSAYSVTGGGSYCEGGQGAEIGLDGSQSGVTYNLILNGSSVKSSEIGTGAAISFGNQTTAGTYTVETSNSECTTVMNGSANITVSSLPVSYSVTGGGSYCSDGSGVSIGLSNSQKGVSYQLKLDADGNSGSPVVGVKDGFSIGFGKRTVPGNYTVVATNSNGCSTTMSGSKTITVLSLPTVYAVTGGGAYCNGGSGVEIGLSDTQTGVTYQLKRDGSNTGNPIAGTGASISFGNQTAAGTYTVVATNSQGCSKTMSGSASITIKSLPIPPSPINDERCGKGIVNLKANPELSEGQTVWFNSGGTEQINTGTAYSPYILETTNYIVKTYNINSKCYSTPVTVTGAVNPKPTKFDVTGGGVNCDGSQGVSINLSGSELNMSYQLKRDGTIVDNKTGTGGSITYEDITTPGDYKIYTDNSASGCSIAMNGTASITEGTSPTVFYVSGGGSICSGGEGAVVNLSNTQDEVTYHLLRDGINTGISISGGGLPISFENITDAGTYTIRAINNISGCSKLMKLKAIVWVNTPPDVPVSVEGDTRSGYGPVTLSAEPGTEGCVVNWYTSDGEFIQSGETYTPNLFRSTDYKVTTYNTETGCESDEVIVTATVNDMYLHDAPKTENKNYSRKVMPKVAVKSISGLDYLTRDQVVEQISYFDGLGRTEQSQVTGTGDMDDYMIQVYSYDKFGRADTSFLPFTNQTEGQYLADARQKQETYYETDDSKNIAISHSPWATVTYDSKSRVEESSSFGDQWQITTGTNYTKKAIYETNLATDSVIKWIPSEDVYLGDVYYTDGKLYKKVVTDENGITAISFTDKDGKLIMKEQEGLQTYYLYDIYGRVKHVLPPEYVENLANTTVPYTVDITDPLVMQYCYTYVYGERSLLVEKHLPGIEKIEYVYDKLNRPVLSRNGNLRNSNQWSFVKYDNFGRTAYSGIWTDDDALSRNQLQDMLFDSDVYETIDFTTGEYSNNAFPQQNTDIHVLNVYDAYPLNTKPYINSKGNEAPTYSINAKGNLTYSKVKVLDGSNTYLETVLYYDTYNRVIQKHSDNIYGMIDIVNMKYNFMGQVTEQVVDHQMPDANSEVVSKYYSYDQAGRLKSIEQEIEADANGRVKMVELEYNKLGQVTAKKLHETASNQFLQTVDYNYNIRGWLTGINDPDEQGTDNDLFAMRLHYNDEIKAETALNNGMISGIEWKIFDSKSTSGTKKRSYAFTYDDHYRLTEADYFDDDATTQENFDVSYNYTTNGKISSLERYGKTGTDLYGKIDDLTYTYTGNQLTKVDDAGLRGESSVLPNNFPDLETTEQTEYLYDENGNMYVDKNKGLTNITYNHLNLPTRVDFEDGSYINFLYDAQGNKLEKEVKQAGSTSDFYTFVGGFIYENDNLAQIVTEQGRVTVSGTTYKYEYYLKDHLGSTRVMFADDGNGNAEILQETHYYPFGLTIDGLSYGSAENNTLFSGKEYNSEINLNWYDFGARNYDPSLGMWFNVDPMAEKYISSSPYHFTANNPVNFRETNGMEFEWRDPDDTPEGGGNFGNGSGAAAPNSILYALLGGYGNMFSSDFFRNSMDEGSFYSSLTTEQYDNLQTFKRAQTFGISSVSEGYYSSNGTYYSVESYGGDRNGNGFVNFTGGTMMFGNGNATEYGGIGTWFAGEGGTAYAEPGDNFLGWVNPQEPDKVDLDNPGFSKQIRLWNWYLKSVNFEKTNGRQYHLTEIFMTPKEAKKLDWNFFKSTNEIVRTGKFGWKGTDVNFIYQIKDGNFSDYGGHNYRFNFVGSTHEDIVGDWHRVSWLNGTKVVADFWFNSYDYKQFFMNY
ncbi:MAG: hypothetical protein KQH79_12840 [Bacteroidetes bacterium]|nr:hypothetical protein [Bacteroidota bacterium]